eukprot:Hpha_TRINITY_DN13321_c0_g2::TRINITY_DN13321_c0_g2_i1::g.95176::m.95176/K15013/ACSBG; long-chain-fatty-acid--CoA ligase ACSBG
MGCAQHKQEVPLEGPPGGCGRNVSAEEVASYSDTSRKSAGGNWWTTDRFEVMPPRVSSDPKSIAGLPPMTLLDMFDRAARNHPDRLALRVERQEDGTPPAGDATEGFSMKCWTWQQYHDESQRAARGFLSLGLADKGSVVVYGFNSPEWLMSFCGAMIAGGCICGVYPTDKKDNVQYKSRHTACNVAVVETTKQLKIVKDAVSDRASGGIPTLRAVVVWSAGSEALEDFTVGNQTIKVLTWDQLVTTEAEKTPHAALASIRQDIKPGNCSGYIYTSGTTGRPKAVMVSHDNVTYLCNCVRKVVPEVGNTGRERIISYLPLSHVAGMLMDIAFPMSLTSKSKSGYITITFARPTDLSKMTLANRIKAVQPTMFLGVPRVWEKIRDKMVESAKEAQAEMSDTDKKRVADAKARGKAWAYNKQLGGTGLRPGGCLDNFIDGKVYQKVRAKLGLSECKYALTGAAPIDTSCLEFFGQLGININEVYGMSECCGATTVSSNAAHVWGSCGFAAPGAEVTIFRSGEHGDCSPNRPKMMSPAYGSFVEMLKKPQPIPEEFCGEVCFRGRHIMMGYLANPDLGPEHVEEIRQKTAEAIDEDGWLHSGDKGAIDKAGMLKITGRFKEIIIPAGGENVSPVPIEEAIKKLLPELVSNVMMVGDGRKYCVALVSLKVVGATGQDPGTNELTRHAAESIHTAGGSATTVEEAMIDPACVRMIAEALVKTNKNSAVVPISAASVKSFTIIPTDFSESGGQLTATLKLKRSVVEAEHASMVGHKTSVEGLDPGYTGILYKGPLQNVPGVGECYARYQ